MFDPKLSRRALLGTMTLAAGVAGFTATGLSLTQAERALATPEGALDLDILYIGAHPDDEASSLAAFGQWVEALGLKAGVITVTRGEGGGNATGFEEGPELGLLREAEEREAVGYAGIEHIFNLDGLDFYYTASAPLSDEVWGGEALLSRIVRVVRATRPELIVTMNPAATQGNHGNHQQAALYAVEAYFAAADPTRFPEHMDEGFEPWTVGRILKQGGTGQGGRGPDAVTAGFNPSDPTDLVFGAWNGTWSEQHGERWSTRLDKAIWAYASQGWASRAPQPTDPPDIPVTWFSVLESRAPLYDPRRDDLAALDGLFRVPSGGLPLGTEINLDLGGFDVVAGSTVAVQVEVYSPENLGNVTVSLDVPDGWSAGSGQVTIGAGQRGAVNLDVTIPASADTNQRVRVWANASAGGWSGRGSEVIRVVSPAHSEMRALPEIEVFRQWTRDVDVEHLQGLLPIFTSIGSGREEELSFDIINDSAQARSGVVRLELPDGFEATPVEQEFGPVAAGERQEVSFTVANTDPSVPFGNQAPDEGAYPFEVVVTSDGVEDRQENFINLVPTLVVEKATAPITVDGSITDGEYPGEPFDITYFWETAEVPPEDLSARAWLTYDDEAFYLALEVQDDHPGVWLPPHDIKRPRRVDAVEISIDPRGDSANTSTVFNVAVFPASDDPANGNPARFARERDNFQGGEETAPGLVAVSTINEPYTGYTLEVKIPFAVLPDALDPSRVGFNVMVNDSDTEDLTAQSRIAWSAFRGVRADPWRWGLLELPELEAQNSDPVDPRMPDTAALSVDSWLSITQAVSDGVPLGGWPPLQDQVPVLANARLSGLALTVDYTAPLAGRAHIFVIEGDQVLGSRAFELSGTGSRTVELTTAASDASQVRVIASFQAGEEVVALQIPFASGGPSPSPSPSPTTSPSPSPTGTSSPRPRPKPPKTGA